MIVPPLIAAYIAKLEGHELRFVWCHIMLMGMYAVWYIFQVLFLVPLCNELVSE